MCINIQDLGHNIKLVYKGTKGEFQSYLNFLVDNMFEDMELDDNGWIVPKEYEQLIKKNYKTEEIISPWSYMGENMKLQPYPYQKEVIYYALNHPESLLVLPPGAGKTAIGIGYYLELLNNDMTDRPCIVCTKASLKYQWVQEVKKFSNLKVKEIKTPTAAGKKFEEQFKNVDVLVLNYETFKNKEVTKRIKKIKPDTLICDEIHYIGNHSAQKSKALHKFNSMSYKIGLTATPVTKDVQNLFSIFKLLKKDLFPLYGEFQRNFLILNRFDDIIGSKDHEGLKDTIEPYTLVKNNKEIAKQLPKLTVHKIECEITPQLRKATNILFDLKKQFDEEKKKMSNKYFGKDNEAVLISEDEDINKLDNKIQECLLLLQQVADDPYLIDTSKSKLKEHISITDKTSPKYDLLISKLEELYSENENEKVCIFTKFERMQKELARRLEKHFSKDNYKFKCALVDGGKNSKERYHQAYDLFQENEDYKVLIATNAMVEGVSLSKCKYLIEYDLSDSYAMQTQRHGRIVRANSISRTSTVYQLIVKDSYDENQLKVIERKEVTHNNLFKEEEED